MHLNPDYPLAFYSFIGILFFYILAEILAIVIDSTSDYSKNNNQINKIEKIKIIKSNY